MLFVWRILFVTSLVAISIFHCVSGLPGGSACDGGKPSIRCKTAKMNQNFKRFLSSFKSAPKLSKRDARDDAQYYDYEEDEYEVPEKSLIDRLVIMPIMISHFIGYAPMRIPGMPYHKDPGAPELSGYNYVNDFHR